MGHTWTRTCFRHQQLRARINACVHARIGANRHTCMLVSTIWNATGLARSLMLFYAHPLLFAHAVRFTWPRISTSPRRHTPTKQHECTIFSRAMKRPSRLPRVSVPFWQYIICNVAGTGAIHTALTLLQCRLPRMVYLDPTLQSMGAQSAPGRPLLGTRYASIGAPALVETCDKTSTDLCCGPGRPCIVCPTCS